MENYTAGILFVNLCFMVAVFSITQAGRSFFPDAVQRVAFGVMLGCVAFAASLGMVPVLFFALCQGLFWMFGAEASMQAYVWFCFFYLAICGLVGLRAWRQSPANVVSDLLS